MDADISAATTSLDIDKIKAQDYRDSIKQATVDRATQRALLQAFLDWNKAQYDALPAELDNAQELRRSMAVAIAAKYFTTSTATLPESVLADAQKDSARFKAALDEAVKAAQ